jgi:arylformamidase
MKIVDLSAELAHHMVRYPSAYLPEVEVVPAATHAKDGRAAHILTFGTHVSTHIDAPFHAIPDGKTVDQLPLSCLIGPAHILRLGMRDKTSPLDVSDFERIAGLERYEKIILETGWGRKWGTKEYFTEGPFLTPDASRFLAKLPKLHLLGMDFPNVDCCQDMVKGKPAPNHQIILGREIVMLENLLRLDEVDDDFLLSANPPRLVGGDGCPCRAVALFPLSELQSWVQAKL